MISIDELNLRKRIRNILIKNGITTIEQLALKTQEDLKPFHIGLRFWDEIKDALGIMEYRNKWIPIERVLPPMFTSVFLVTEVNGAHVGSLIGINPFKWTIEGKVTHWFPYPSYSRSCGIKFIQQMEKWKNDERNRNRRKAYTGTQC